MTDHTDPTDHAAEAIAEVVERLIASRSIAWLAEAAGDVPVSVTPRTPRRASRTVALVVPSAPRRGARATAPTLQEVA